MVILSRLEYNKLINTALEISASLDIGSAFRVIAFCLNIDLFLKKNMDSQHNNYNNVIYLAYFVKIVVRDLIISVLSSAGAIFVKILTTISN